MTDIHNLTSNNSYLVAPTGEGELSLIDGGVSKQMKTAFKIDLTLFIIQAIVFIGVKVILKHSPIEFLVVVQLCFVGFVFLVMRSICYNDNPKSEKVSMLKFYKIFIYICIAFYSFWVGFFGFLIGIYLYRAQGNDFLFLGGLLIVVVGYPLFFVVTLYRNSSKMIIT